MKKENKNRTIAWTLVAVLLIATGCYRWIYLQKDDPTSGELWGRMNKAAQEKLATEINRSFIRLHPDCRSSALEIKSYADVLIIMVKCESGRTGEGIGNVQLINFN